MCCLVGAAGAIQKDEIEAFKQLLLIGGFRGAHSTGVAKVERHNKEVKVFKKAMNPYEFVECHGFDQTATFGAQALLGHNRYATVGKVIHMNAHPFDFDTIVGSHNGTLHNKHDLVKYEQFGTDSEALLYNINLYGAENVIPKMRGAWALTWYDKKDNTINFLRNADRPFYFVSTEDRKTLFWASEARMLSFVLNRVGIRFDKIWGLNEDLLVSIPIPKMGDEFKKEEFVKTPMRGGKDVVSNIWPKHNRYGLPHREVAKDCQLPLLPTTPSTTHNGVTSLPLLPKKKPEETHEEYRQRVKDELRRRAINKGLSDKKLSEVVAHALNPTGTHLHPAANHNGCPDDTQYYDNQEQTKAAIYRGYKGKELQRLDFELATQDGCINCGTNVSWGDAVKFTAEDEFLCLACKDLINWAS